MRGISILCAAAAVAHLAAVSVFATEAQTPGSGVPFNGETTYAEAANGEAFDLDQFTVSAWARFKQTRGSQVLVNRGNPGSLFTLYLYEGRVRMLVEHASPRYTHANVDAPEAGTGYVAGGDDHSV